MTDSKSLSNTDHLRLGTEAPAFIQTVITVVHGGARPVSLPPVVGRGFARLLIRLIQLDLPSARIYTADTFHETLSKLDLALGLSDRMLELTRQALENKNPGRTLLSRLDQIGGAQ